MRLAPCLVVASLAVPATASAHIQLTYPTQRTSSLKQPNCGLTGSTRSATPTVFAPGETITVAWDETIDHPGHFRVSFDDAGEDFTIPLGFDDTTQSENVLFDLISDDGTKSQFTQEITLPDIECETCTIQVIQMMTDKAPYGDGNDIYFQCADIALRAGGGGGNDGGIDPGGDDVGSATGGCSTTGGDASGLALIALVAGLGYVAPTKKRRNRQLRAFQASSSWVAPGSQK
jgi:hypothetical protein